MTKIRLLSLLILWPCLCFSADLSPMQAQEVKRWTFFKEPSVYASDGFLIIHDQSEKETLLSLFCPKTKKTISIPLPKGEGPGEIGFSKGALIRNNQLFLWDPQLLRLDLFNLTPKGFIKATPFPAQFFTAHMITFKNNLPVFAVSRSLRYEGKRGMSQQIEGLGERPLVIIPVTPPDTEKFWSLALPRMLSAGNETHIAYANNLTYRITLHPLVTPPTVLIEQKIADIAWSDQLKKLFTRHSSAQSLEMGKHGKPQKVPPLQALSLSQNRIAICLNSKLEHEQASIDLFNLHGQYLGQVLIPALYSQFWIQLPFQFLQGFVLVDDHHLAALHYDHNEEQFVVALYRLPI